jgi:hypothetical protein
VGVPWEYLCVNVPTIKSIDFPPAPINSERQVDSVYSKRVGALAVIAINVIIAGI